MFPRVFLCIKCVAVTVLPALQKVANGVEKGGLLQAERPPLECRKTPFCKQGYRLSFALGVPFKQQAAWYAVAYGRVKRVFRILPAPLQYQDFNL